MNRDEDTQNIIRFWSIYQMILNGLLLFINSCIVCIRLSVCLSVYFHHWDVNGRTCFRHTVCPKKMFLRFSLEFEKCVKNIHASFCVDVFMPIAQVHIKFSFAASVTICAFYLFIHWWIHRDDLENYLKWMEWLHWKLLIWKNSTPENCWCFFGFL